MNTVQPIETTNGYVYPANGAVLDPNFGCINTANTWSADSHYCAMQASVKRSFNTGIRRL